jgi:DNA processing protein
VLEHAEGPGAAPGGGRGGGEQACELKYWFWLGAMAGLSARRAKMLADAFGNPYEVWIQGAEALGRLEFMNRQSVAQVLNAGVRGGISQAMAAVQARGIDIVPLCDSQYPEYVKAISDPPLILFRRGHIGGRLRDRAVAIVGSRHPTAYGVRVARTLAGDLAARGYTIVSGMAMGIDAAAHAEALAAGGSTVAFLGCGVDRAYPASNRRLMDEIVGHGEVYSEFMPGALPMQQNFPQRNRLISGMCAGVVVVEAGERSGALITAGFAGEQGRDVFAVPGNINSPLSRGTNALIRDGAIPVTSADDILEALNPFFAGCADGGGCDGDGDAGAGGSGGYWGAGDDDSLCGGGKAGNGNAGSNANTSNGNSAGKGAGKGAGSGMASGCDGGRGVGGERGAGSVGRAGAARGAAGGVAGCRGAGAGSGVGVCGGGIGNGIVRAGATGLGRRSAAAARGGTAGGGAASGKARIALAELDGPSRAIARMLMERGPMDMDSIISESGFSAGAAGSTLVLLELRGAVRSLPGDAYEIAD